MKQCIILFFILFTSISWGQTKIGGHIIDEQGQPIPYANIIFTNSTEGTISDENGKFYLESQNSYNTVEISFIGFKTQTVTLTQSTSLHLKITLKEDAEQLAAVEIYSGKTSKKNNPAIAILRKIWANKRQNGVHQYKQYQYDKYEKLEFDLNAIDSAMIHSPLFKGMRFIFNYMDTSAISGKTYLPIFINESASKVYGDNNLNKKKEILTGNRNSGFNNNHALVAYLKELYNEYNVYDNYLQIFDKSFVSPLSRTGINVYNYVLADSSFIDNKWCYRIVYYPRRKNELTFKGDFWVNDTTWAIKKIDLEMSKSANINWVNEVYIEQEFDVLNDSTFVMTRDHFMANFALKKKEDAHGIYGKRTTLYDQYAFNLEKGSAFYTDSRMAPSQQIFNRDDAFWRDHRIEQLSTKEQGIYKMLDTLKTTRAFKRMYDIGSILATGYISFEGFDYGPLFSTFGYNDVEGIRLRFGGRTYFSQNDRWRLEGFGAIGLKDGKFKYGILGKWLVDPKTRLKLMLGHRHDIEQLGASLTNTTDVLGRSLASASLVTVGSNETLSEIQLTTAAIEWSPFTNFKVRFGASHRQLKPASPEFSLAYYTDAAHTQTAQNIEQTEISTALTYTPGKRTTGYGVDRLVLNEGDYPSLFFNYTLGVKGLFNSDFDYKKLEFLYSQPIHLGGLGKLTATVELGKILGEVPLGLLSVVPGNQTILSIYGSFPLLNYYEFVTDSYASFHLEHNFNGRLFSRIPLLRKLNLRELVGISGVVGSISDENQALNASTSHPVLRAPNDEMYWEWSVGVGNIFRVFRIDFHFRGNYLDNPDARKFGVTGSFQLNF